RPRVALQAGRPSRASARESPCSVPPDTRSPTEIPDPLRAPRPALFRGMLLAPPRHPSASSFVPLRSWVRSHRSIPLRHGEATRRASGSQVRRGVCGESANKPTQEEEDSAYEKDGETWRIIPGMIDILADVEQRPKDERAYAEILNDLCSLVRERRETLALGGIGQISKV